jgi:hypothetical protein
LRPDGQFQVIGQRRPKGKNFGKIKANRANARASTGPKTIKAI